MYKLWKKGGRKIMKRVSKIVAILMMIAIMMQNVIVLANVVSLGEIKYIERGDRGFYSLQHWNEEKEIWQYVTYSRTYYTDDNGEKRIAYCITPDKLGVGWIRDEYEGYNTVIQEKLSNVKLWRVYKNGYPYVMPEELGVETEDDAYVATKQAAYCILRGYTAEMVYDYYRAGTSSIEGEDVSEIKRRGQKIVDAIYRLVEIGNHGSETMNGVLISKVGEFQKASNKNCHCQQYKIENNNEDISVTITNVLNAPKNTYIADSQGKKETTFHGGDVFQVMVPDEQIDHDVQVTIEYKSTCKNYPIYYAKSTIDNTQDYLLSAAKFEDETGKLNFFINSKKSGIKIIKQDLDTKQPLQGVQFHLKYETGEEIGTFTTDQQGSIQLNQLKQGTILMNEIKPLEGYCIEEKDYTYPLTYDAVNSIVIYNSRQKGELEVLKVDQDDEGALAGVEFELIDSEGKSVAKQETNEGGYILFKNLKIGEYILRETKSLEGYHTADDQKVIIKPNEKNSLTVINEKKKGQIQILKVDKDDHTIKLSNTKFEIKDNAGNMIETLTTNQEGLAVSSKLPIGEYQIQEIQTGEKYVLDQELHTITVKENEVSEITIQNEKKKGIIQIQKVSADDNKLNHMKKGSPISNTKFEIYSSNGELIQTVETNEEGIATTERLELGHYIIQEVEAGQWYLLNAEKQEVEITENEQIVEIMIENHSANPKIEIYKSGPEKAYPGEEIQYDFLITNSGNTAVSQFTWYDFLPFEQAKITKFYTGTYNQQITYGVYYKTNLKQEYMPVKENLDSQENYYLDLSEIYLADGEKISEIKVEFGDVAEGFQSVNQPYLILKLNNQLIADTQVINETILEGHYQEYKLTSEDTVTTIIQKKKEEVKRLPRTGY